MPVEQPDTIGHTLRRFEHLAGLGDEALATLAKQVTVHHATAGSCLLEMGSRDPHLLFLVDGELELLASDGLVHHVRHTDPAARDPVSRLRPSRYRVRALGPVRYLLIDRAVVDELMRRERSEAMHVDETGFEVDVIDPAASDGAAAHPLMADVFADINNGQVFLPSEPGIAVLASEGLRAAESNPRRATAILATCPSLALKAVRAARDRDPQRRPVHSLRTAVDRLGVHAVADLAVQSVLRESLHAPTGSTQQLFGQWWERTLRVAAACVAIAGHSERFDPGFANLIGLAHGFGEGVLLRYAARHGDPQADAALADAIRHNRAQVGRILGVLWGLPTEIVDAVTRVNDWHFTHAGDADYTDIVLAAQWYADATQRPADRRGVPALQRLGLFAGATFETEVVAAVDRAVPDARALLA